MNNLKQDLGLLVLRIGMGLALLPHGLSKVSMLFSGNEIHFYNFLGLGPSISLVLATLAEAACSILVVVGLKTRWVAMPVVFTMFIAGHIANHGNPWARKELATAYLIGFLAIAIMGAGRYSLDSLIGSKKKTEASI